MLWQVLKQNRPWAKVREMKTFWERFKGVMFLERDAVTDEALWFPDCKSLHTFFCRFDLDVVFLDADHQVVSVHANTPAGHFVSSRLADSVLEFPSHSLALPDVGEYLEFRRC